MPRSRNELPSNISESRDTTATKLGELIEMWTMRGNKMITMFNGLFGILNHEEQEKVIHALCLHDHDFHVHIDQAIEELVKIREACESHNMRIGAKQ